MTNSIRDYKSLLISFIEAVTFLLAAFGGFLRHIAPPEQTGAAYAVGILSFLILIVLMIISAISRKAPGTKFRRAWIIAGAVAFVLAIPPFFLYPHALALYTWTYPAGNPVKRVRGLDAEFTEPVKAFLKQNPGPTTP